jgi:hypothetical protein
MRSDHNRDKKYSYLRQAMKTWRSGKIKRKPVILRRKACQEITFRPSAWRENL